VQVGLEVPLILQVTTEQITVLREGTVLFQALQQSLRVHLPALEDPVALLLIFSETIVMVDAGSIMKVLMETVEQEEAVQTVQLCSTVVTVLPGCIAEVQMIKAAVVAVVLVLLPMAATLRELQQVVAEVMHPVEMEQMVLCNPMVQVIWVPMEIMEIH
jgi:hypothetical protein